MYGRKTFAARVTWLEKGKITVSRNRCFYSAFNNFSAIPKDAACAYTIRQYKDTRKKNEKLRHFSICDALQWRSSLRNIMWIHWNGLRVWVEPCVQIAMHVYILLCIFGTVRMIIVADSFDKTFKFELFKKKTVQKNYTYIYVCDIFFFFRWFCWSGEFDV